MYRRYETHLSDAEIQFEIQKLVEKARNSKEVKVVRLQTNGAWLWRVAAAAVVVLGLGWWYFSTPRNTYDQMVAGQPLIEKKNQTTTTQIMVLSDGNKVTLEPNARISFTKQFTTDKREVYLSGTAFFEVTKDAKRPFLVYANELVTKVLGTKFTVKALDGGQETTVEVKEGKVSVFKNANFQKNKEEAESNGLVVTTNQKIVFERETTQMVKTLRDVPEVVETASALPSFEFKNAPVSEVLVAIEEAYQVDIIFDKELLADCPLTATLTDQPLYEKLSIICEAIEAHYQIIDGQIVVSSKGCKN